MTQSVQPKRAEAVIVGGGVVGCALAYALVKGGMRDVVLLERDRLGCGTTWHSAANIAMLDASSASYVDFYARNMDLFKRLADETGQEVGWRQTGRLQFATNERRVRALRHVQAVAKAHGLAWDWVQPEAARERLPIIATEGLLGALWAPTVGRVNATDLLAAYAKAVRAQGATILEGTPLRAIGRTGGRISAVETDKGTIETPRVIDCAGLWAPQVARLVGVELPIHANEHFYILTKAFEGIYKDMPSFRDADALIYGREEVGGLLLGCFETRAKPLPVEALPADFSFGLLPDDWDQFLPYMHAAIARIPGLEQAEVKILLNGPESFTPDGRFIGGAVPEVPGFFVLAGMNSSGVNNSAGSARALAQLILTGQSDLDLSPFSPTRFAAFHARPDWLRERISEAPGYLYGYVRPYRDFETGRNLRLGPLHHRLQAAGASFHSVMGWERPSDFGDLEGEIGALESGVALADQGAATRLELSGPDAAAIIAERLGGLTLAVGACAVALAPAPRGVESLLLVARSGAERFLILGEASRETADRLLLAPEGRQAQLLPRHSSLAQLQLAGPRAGALLSGLLGGPAPAPGAFRKVTIGGAGVKLLCHPWSGDFLLLTASEYANHLADRLEAATPMPRWVGQTALEARRIALRLPALGSEVGPLQPGGTAGLEQGADGAWRPRANRGLVGGSVAAQPYGGEPLWSGGKVIGWVTSTGPRRAEGRAAFLALAALATGPVTMALEGDELPVQIGG